MWWIAAALATERPDALTDEMRDWVATVVPRAAADGDQLERLRAALDSRLTYAAGHTGTAAEVWESGTYDCLSLTLLFVAMAREAGVDATFLRVEGAERYLEDGTLVIVAGHVTAGWGPPARMRTIDLGFGEAAEPARLERLSDDEMLGLFDVNVGAERLRGGEVEAALALFEDAVTRAPELVEAWVNVGVARRRSGDADGAEAAYRRAIALDPGRTSAWNDLAVLTRLRGDEDRTRELLALADRPGNRDPFTYLQLGDWSLRGGDADGALRFYRRARVLEPWHPSVLAAMGAQALEAGAPDRALRWLRRAQKAGATNPRVAALALRLDARTPRNLPW